MRLLPALLALGLALPAGAAETVRFVTQEYVGYAQPDGKGYYLALLRAVFPKPDYDVQLRWAPFERSVQLVETKTADVTPGVSADRKGVLFSQLATDLDAFDVAVRKGAFPGWKGLPTLAGQRAVAQIGYGFDQYAPEVKMHYEEKSSLEGMLQMLVSSRVDAVLDYEEDMRQAAAKLKLANRIEIRPSGISKPLYFAFADNDKGRKLKARFDAEVAKLKASGRLKQIFLGEINKPRAFPG